MPPEVAARAFEAFYTTKDVGKGTGLGLDIARRIVVERHGGAIMIDSRPGETIVRVRLPNSAKLSQGSGSLARWRGDHRPVAHAGLTHTAIANG